MILLCALATPTYFADGASEKAEKKYPKLDSGLQQLYEEEAAEGLHSPVTASDASGQDAQRVKVVLKMVSIDAPIPQDLGIEVELTHEDLVQATVPILNLPQIASDENVKYITLPSRPTLATVQPVLEHAPGESDLIYLLMVPAVAASVIIGIIAYQRRISTR